MYIFRDICDRATWLNLVQKWTSPKKKLRTVELNNDNHVTVHNFNTKMSTFSKSSEKIVFILIVKKKN